MKDDTSRKIEMLMNAGGIDGARKNTKGADKLPIWLSEEELQDVRAFHARLKKNVAAETASTASNGDTPLVSLPALAKKLGVRGIYIKDESKRFGLNAFKGLGASYAVKCASEEHIKAAITGGAISNNTTGTGKSVDSATSSGTGGTTGVGKQGLLFVTATDGNHGRAVAWSASKIPGASARVFMPKGSAEVRAEAIRSHGQTICEITDLSYDDAVRHAAAFADENGGILVQDTSFEGYVEIPRKITQGYTTMAFEALSQLIKAADSSSGGDIRPTHVFLQAGVGSMAGGVLGYLANVYKENLPVVTIMEPSDVACVFESAVHGKPTAVVEPEGVVPEGETITEMAGLNCGEVNLDTWPILRDFATAYTKCPDWVTELGIRTLGRPLPGDAAVVSGESGAVGAGLVAALLSMPEYQGLATSLGLGPDSVILLFSTEGATDPENYNRILHATE